MIAVAGAGVASHAKPWSRIARVPACLVLLNPYLLMNEEWKNVPIFADVRHTYQLLSGHRQCSFCMEVPAFVLVLPCLFLF